MLCDLFGPTRGNLYIYMCTLYSTDDKLKPQPHLSTYTHSLFLVFKGNMMYVWFLEVEYEKEFVLYDSSYI